MNKRHILFLMASICQINVIAQEWITTHFEADELTETQAHDSYRYTDENENSIVFWSFENTDFRIVSGSGIFDYNGAIRSFYAIIGYYDNDGKLIEKNEIQMCAFEGAGNQAQANLDPLIRPFPNKRRCQQLQNYLQNNHGYVRIVAPLFGENSKFDFRVPCMNNNFTETMDEVTSNTKPLNAIVPKEITSVYEAFRSGSIHSLSSKEKTSLENAFISEIETDLENATTKDELDIINTKIAYLDQYSLIQIKMKSEVKRLRDELISRRNNLL